MVIIWWLLCLYNVDGYDDDGLMMMVNDDG